MRIGIAAWDLEDPDSPELTQTGKDLGHDTTMFYLSDVTCQDTGDLLVPTIKGEPVSEFDIIISRAEIRYQHAQADHERYALLSLDPRVTVLDPADVYLTAESKVLALRRLAAAGLPIAPTRVGRNLADVQAAYADWGQVVVKPSFGYGGKDVERVLDLDQDRDRVTALLGKHERLLCQPYFPHPQGDIRVTVVGDETPLSFNRIPKAPAWKSNASQGAEAIVTATPPELAAISTRAAQVMGVTLAGLDFLPTPDGYRIIEFNNCPGWFPVPADARRHLTERIIEVAVSIRNARRDLAGRAPAARSSW
ncbi:MAG TPA: hypothetical protein VH478_12145 [Trebonia sp.]|nr:hypothetical protein [Trebonia sp.]